MDDLDRYQLYNDDDTTCCDAKTKKIGIAYIFVNQKFTHRNWPYRAGAYKDYQNMKKVFKPLGFKLYPFVNKSEDEMREILLKASQRPDLQNFSCFVCVISSHGEEAPSDKVHDNLRVQEHFIIGIHGGKLKTRDIIDMFMEDNCRALVDKPKLFFLQACRENVDEKDESKKYDHGVKIHGPKKKKSFFRKSKRDASDARPSNPDDEVLSEQRNEAHATAEHDENGFDLEEDEDELDSDDEDEEEGDTDNDSVTNTTDDDSEDEYRENNKEFTQLTEEEFTQLTEEEFTQLTEEELAIHNSEQAGSSLTGGGDEADTGQRNNKVNTVLIPIKIIDTDSIPCYKDMLVMFASPPGKLAWRSCSKGSWLLLNLHKVLCRHINEGDIHKHDLLSILTDVARHVSFENTDTGEEDSSGKKMIPVIHHQLTKNIVFRTPELIPRIKSVLGLY